LDSLFISGITPLREKLKVISTIWPEIFRLSYCPLFAPFGGGPGGAPSGTATNCPSNDLQVALIVPPGVDISTEVPSLLSLHASNAACGGRLRSPEGLCGVEEAHAMAGRVKATNRQNILIRLKLCLHIVFSFRQSVRIAHFWKTSHNKQCNIAIRDALLFW
jgi:hypothetical protein